MFHPFLTGEIPQPHKKNLSFVYLFRLPLLETLKLLIDKYVLLLCVCVASRCDADGDGVDDDDVNGPKWSE